MTTVAPGSPMTVPSSTGRLVLVNGAPASGKTSLSRALQELMLERHGETWLTIHIDEFMAMSMKGLQGPGRGLWHERLDDGATAVRFDERTRPLADGAVLAAIACARAGLDVIADCLRFDAAAARHWDAPVAGLWCLRVGLVCPMETLMARATERERATGTPAGLSKHYFDVVHERASYDVCIDASEVDTERAAEHVAALIRAEMRSAPTGARRS